LIDLQLIDAPIRVDESARVIPDEINAGCSLGSTSRSLVVPERVTGVITTEINIHDDMLIPKMVIESAACGKFRKRYTPKLRVRGASSDIRGYGISREKPNGDTITSPLCGVYSTTNIVETGAIGRWAGRIN
jgi:hypothetical protein